MGRPIGLYPFSPFQTLHSLWLSSIPEVLIVLHVSLKNFSLKIIDKMTKLLGASSLHIVWQFLLLRHFWRQQKKKLIFPFSSLTLSLLKYFLLFLFMTFGPEDYLILYPKLRLRKAYADVPRVALNWKTGSKNGHSPDADGFPPPVNFYWPFI